MDREAWRRQVVEAALDPELPIIDAHHHIWLKSPMEPWEAYPPERLIADKARSAHNVIATIYVDSHAHYHVDGPAEFTFVGETVFAEEVAQDSMRRGGREAAVCAAIVTRADLKMGSAVGAVLDAHMAASPRFRGIRYMTAIDPGLPPIHGGTEFGVLMDPKFREGFAELAPRGLSFDAWAFHPQLPELVDLSRQFPETVIIVDHLGGPLLVGRYATRQEEAFAEWKGNMASLAECPNVFVKLGGLNMSTTAMEVLDQPAPNPSVKTAEMQRRHVLTAVDLFGPQRCMFESNFPVDMYSLSYDMLWNAFKRMTLDFSRADRLDLFSGTASRVYRLAD